MEGNFRIIAFTPEEPVDNEALKIAHLLDSGAVDDVHLRHPQADECQMAAILDAIPSTLHHKIHIHSCFNLLQRYNLAGAHLNSRWGKEKLPTNCNAKLSLSCHSISDVKSSLNQGFDYVTLSPIYPSISKAGYVGDFSDEDIAQSTEIAPIIALGGITPERFAQLSQQGFSGAALLGYIWQHNDNDALCRRLRIMRPGVFDLQYITNGNTPDEVAKEVAAVLQGGCRWVQVRMKDADNATVAVALEKVKPLCRAKNAILLVDDRVDLVKATDIDGVHLGQEDMPPDKARNILGPNVIIGSTANSLTDVQALDFTSIDYAGVGPLRYTTTKKRLAPVLGYNGFEEIMQWLGNRLPVVGIGGVTFADVLRLRLTGVAGVAVSGAIRNAPDPIAATSSFLTNK